MSYLWLALAAALLASAIALLARRPRWAPPAAVAGSLVVGVVRAAQPTLFHAENGFVLTLVVFGFLPLVIGLAIGLSAQALFRR